MVYDLAGSKAQLFQRFLERALDTMSAQVEAAVGTSADLWQGLRAGLAEFFRFGDSHPAELNLVISGSGDPELNITLQALRTQSNQSLAALLANVARQSGADVDERLAEGLAAAVQGAGDYFARWRLTARPDLSPDAAAEMVADLLEPGLRAQLTGRRAP